MTAITFPDIFAGYTVLQGNGDGETVRLSPGRTRPSLRASCVRRAWFDDDTIHQRTSLGVGVDLKQGDVAQGIEASRQIY